MPLFSNYFIFRLNKSKWSLVWEVIRIFHVHPILMFDPKNSFTHLNRKHLQSIPQYYFHLSFLQSACANAIRNIVSRSKELVPEFIALDVEPLLNDILEKHPQSSYACKRALTDLDLHVVLEEKWTGGAVKQDDE